MKLIFNFIIIFLNILNIKSLKNLNMQNKQVSFSLKEILTAILLGTGLIICGYLSFSARKNYAKRYSYDPVAVAETGVTAIDGRLDHYSSDLMPVPTNGSAFKANLERYIKITQLRGGGIGENSLSSNSGIRSTNTRESSIFGNLGLSRVYQTRVSQSLVASPSNSGSFSAQTRARLNPESEASYSHGQSKPLYSPSGSGIALTAGEQNSTRFGFTNRALDKVKETCFSRCCALRSSTSTTNSSTTNLTSTTNVIPFGYSLRLTTSPSIAPPIQMMSKRVPSATEQIRKSFPQPLKTLFSDDRIELDLEKKVYGVGLYPPIAQKRLENSFPNVKKELGIIMVCPLGTPQSTARTELEKQINAWNASHASPDEKLWLNTSTREKNGDQARFSLPIPSEIKNFSIPKIEFVIWVQEKKSPKTGSVKQTAKIMLLGDVPYDQRKRMLSIIRDEKENIKKSLPSLPESDTWELISNSHYDHFLGANDSEAINVSHETANTHQVPDVFNLSRIMDPESLSSKNVDSATETLLNDLGERA